MCNKKPREGWLMIASYGENGSGPITEIEEWPFYIGVYS